MAINTVLVDSLQDKALEAYAHLTEAQLRNKLEPEQGIFIAESFKVIERALDAGFVPLSLLVIPHWLDMTYKTLNDYGIKDTTVYVGEASVLEGLTGYELTRGALAAFRRPELPTVEELTKYAKSIAVIDGVVDHTNIGAIFRSAAAIGVDAVLVTPASCDPLYRRAVRVSMGTVFQVPWTRICTTMDDWLKNGINELKDLGFATISCALSKTARELDDPVFDTLERIALVFGTEGDGLSPKVIEACDYVARIPMMNNVDSLNVAAASAVFFWHLCRKNSKRLLMTNAETTL